MRGSLWGNHSKLNFKIILKDNIHYFYSASKSKDWPKRGNVGGQQENTMVRVQKAEGVNNFIFESQEYTTKTNKAKKLFLPCKHFSLLLYDSH